MDIEKLFWLALIAAAVWHHYWRKANQTPEEKQAAAARAEAKTALMKTGGSLILGIIRKRLGG